MAAAYPALTGCQRGPRVADTDIVGVSLDGGEIVLKKSEINELAGSLSGPVILSGHPEYDTSRKIWNGMHDMRPALIVRCMSSEDVSQAVVFAHEHRLLTAVRGGGHSWPGKSLCDRGIVIDLSRMNVVSVDSAAQRARARGGALLNALDSATLQHGLVTTTGVVSHTGVGGLTLGGGFGRLNRTLGLTIDNLVGAEIVTADGRVRKIGAEQEPDLFWAIRGGGGNFGVVTEFEYRLHPFNRSLLNGSIVWPRAQARDVLEFYAGWAPGLSDEMYVGPVMATDPKLGEIAVMDVVYNGDPAAGEKELAPLRKIGKPLVDGVTVQDYMLLQTVNDVPFAHGIRSYAKNGMIKEWSQGLVDALVDAYDPRLFQANHVAGGAVKRVGELDTAFPHRNAEIMIVVAAGWTDASQDESMIALARDYYRAIAPYTGGYYDNIDFDRGAAAGNYGPAYARLAKIKSEFDPDNLFRLNSNIEPA
jgi:FAD/FMN-containing dehydrogenase